MTHVFPTTSHGVFLIGGLFQDGPYRFFLPNPSADQLPGLACELTARLSLYDQLEARLRKSFPHVLWQLDICPDFFSLLSGNEKQREENSEVALYLVLASPSTMNHFPPNHLRTFPEILRQMEKNRNRLPYLRAWQYLNGDHKLTTQALESDKFPL